MLITICPKLLAQRGTPSKSSMLWSKALSAVEKDKILCRSCHGFSPCFCWGVPVNSTWNKTGYVRYMGCRLSGVKIMGTNQFIQCDRAFNLNRLGRGSVQRSWAIKYGRKPLTPKGTRYIYIKIWVCLNLALSSTYPYNSKRFKNCIPAVETGQLSFTTFLDKPNLSRVAMPIWLVVSGDHHG